jgi:hypothetical protein
VSVDVGEPPDGTGNGLGVKLAVTPDGKGDAEGMLRVTEPPKPLSEVTVIVVLPEDPGSMVRDDGDAEKKSKSGGDGLVTLSE